MDEVFKSFLISAVVMYFAIANYSEFKEGWVQFKMDVNGETRMEDK